MVESALAWAATIDGSIDFRMQNSEYEGYTADSKTDDESVVTGVVMPMLKCISLQEYGLHDDYNNRRTMFFEKICISNDNMKKGRFPKVSNFMNSYILECGPQKAADPFYMFGVDLFCVREHNDIFKNEELDVTVVDMTINKVAEDVEQFFRKLTKHKDHSKHFLGNVLSELEHARRYGLEWVKEFREQYYGQDVAFTALWDYLEYVYLDSWSYKTEAEVQESIDHLKESELQVFSSFLLNLDGKCYISRTLILNQFTYSCDDKQHAEIQYTPDLVYRLDKETKTVIVNVKADNNGYRTLVTVECEGVVKSSPQKPKLMTQVSEEYETSKVSRSRDWITVHIDPELLWQNFEQLLAMMFETKHDTKGKKKKVPTATLR